MSSVFYVVGVSMLFSLYLPVFLVAYLVGSFPTGYVLARAKGMDIRQQGSGNIGATNVFRMLGKPIGTVVLLVDFLKGAVACLLVPPAVIGVLGAEPAGPGWAMDLLPLIAALAAIVGHNYPIWLRFRGGKGIATSAGVLTALVPFVVVILLVIWGAVFGLSRYVSLASVVAAGGLPIVTALLGHKGPILWATIVIGVLAIYRHRGNIDRLWHGTEHRFGTQRAGESKQS